VVQEPIRSIDCLSDSMQLTAVSGQL
jgi:hypothetical protein